MNRRIRTFIFPFSYISFGLGTIARARADYAMGNGTATATAGREGDLGHPRRRPMARTCASSLARVVQQDGVWPGLTEEGARMARCMAIEDGEVPTSDSPTLSLHQRLSLAHPVAAGRYDTLHPDLDPFWQWVAMKQARENQRGDFIRDTRVLIHVGKNPGSRLWSTCDEARREYRKLCRQ